MNDQAALRKVLGPLGCQMRAALLCATADLYEIATMLDPLAWAQVYCLAAGVIATAQAH